MSNIVNMVQTKGAGLQQNRQCRWNRLRPRVLL